MKIKLLQANLIIQSKLLQSIVQIASLLNVTVLPTGIENIENSTGSLIPCRVLFNSGLKCDFITKHITLISHLKAKRVLSSVTGLLCQIMVTHL